jgi:acetoin utilization deacetylase AcuC-like enzyme
MCQTDETVNGALWLVDDPLFDEHECLFGAHPERPERLDAARKAVDVCVARGMSFKRLPPRDATEQELARAHTTRYLESLASASGRAMQLDPDTFVSPGSIPAARRAAGGTISMVEHILDGPTSRGLALVRPPGHHATPDGAMGFCLLNNVALGAHAALARGIERIAIVDWDVHHGNGTQEMFWTDPRVLFVSVHQYPLYPGTGSPLEIGADDGLGFTANVALSHGAGDVAYEMAFRRIALPILEEFRPELVLVSAGFDAHARDALAAMRLTDRGYGWMARALAAVAGRHAKDRIGLVLEGGYDLNALEGSLEATIDGLTGVGGVGDVARPEGPILALPDSPPEREEAAPVSLRHGREILRTHEALAPMWKSL